MLTHYKSTQLYVLPEILGFKLVPFTIGHHFLLNALDSPLVKGGLTNEESLHLFAFICSRSAETAKTEISNDVYITQKLGLPAEFWEFDLKEETDKANAYIEWFSSTPPRQPSSSKSAVKVPWELWLVAVLSKNLSTPVSEVWDWPLNMCFSYKAALDNINGDTDLMDEKDIETRDKIEKMKVIAGLAEEPAPSRL